MEGKRVLILGPLADLLARGRRLAAVVHGGGGVAAAEAGLTFTNTRPTHAGEKMDG